MFPWTGLLPATLNWILIRKLNLTHRKRGVRQEETETERDRGKEKMREMRRERKRERERYGGKREKEREIRGR